jgi:hypothetical protein
MTLRERINRTEATCQGCHQCKWGAIAPCPSQTAVWHRARREPEWMRRKREIGLPAKEMTLA